MKDNLPQNCLEGRAGGGTRSSVIRRIMLLCKDILKLVSPEVFSVVRRQHYLRILSSAGVGFEPDLYIVSFLVKPGDKVIDIGANIGVYTKVLSEMVGKTGTVYSMEPFPDTFALLAHNVRQLKLQNVTLINAAASDCSGNLKMRLPMGNAGEETHYRASIVPGEQLNGDESTVAVRSATVDEEFCPIMREVTFLKCDVEGHELSCLQGASQFLAGTDCALLVEVSGNPDLPGTQASSVFNLLRQKGYSAWWYNGKNLVHRQRGDTSVNYFFLKEMHIKKLSSSGSGTLLGSPLR